MSFTNGTSRGRGPSNGEGGPRAGVESRNGATSAMGFDGAMSRAEKFEDEKRRIVDSCFDKTDPDGSVSESYITHIRILEDAAYPSEPPPPSSPQQNKKPRIIIVAVRRSGRVRMHKARENANGTFSIGKTWVLDDLSAIESFIGIRPNTPEQQQRKAWAGSVGFLVTIQKPYYWQATTSKERDFFISSLIKIYRKYTGGKLPELLGFDQQELDSLVGSGQRPSQASTPNRNGLSPMPSPLGQTPSPHETPREFNRDPRSRQASANTIQEDREGEGGISDTQSVTGNARAPRTRDVNPRLQALRGVSPAASTRSETSTPTSQDERSQRSVAPSQSTESFQSRREQQRAPPQLGATNTASSDRLRTNGAYPPNFRPKSPSREVHDGAMSPGPVVPPSLRVRPTSPIQGRPDQLPERRRPPISIPGSIERSFGPDSPQEFRTPGAFPKDEEEDNPISPLSFDRNRAIETSTNRNEANPPKDYFSAPASPIKEEAKSVEELPVRSPPPTAALPDCPLLNTTNDESKYPIPTETPPIVESPVEETHRPGLGPMIKKKSQKEIASRFRQAAMAANAFKPRNAATNKFQSDTPARSGSGDGINGVFSVNPRPSTPRQDSGTLPTAAANNITSTNVTTAIVEPLVGDTANTIPETAKADAPRGVPEVTITESPSPPAKTQIPVRDDQSVSASHQLAPEPSPAPQEDRRRKRPSNHSAKYAKALGIDANLLEGRTMDLESTLADLGWIDDQKDDQNYEDLHNDIRRDLARVETGSWLGGFDTNDERVGAIGKMLDKAIDECEELDGLLTLYNAELGTLSEDIAYIEAQSQGLQVQTANQRLLQTELQTLLETIMISASRLQSLKEASLSKPQGVQSVEAALVQLYKAIITIDPRLRNHEGSRPTTSDQLDVHRLSGVDRMSSEVSTMRAVQERKEGYRRESYEFVYRFKQYISVEFRKAETATLEAIERGRGKMPLKGATKLDLNLRERSRVGLWMYSPLMLFTREIDITEWTELMRTYESTTKKPYQDEFRDNVAAWKRVARKSSGEEQATLFTSQEKEPEGIVGRKLTVKRSKTVRDAVRNSSGEKNQDGNLSGYESFAGALFDMAMSIATEQNFIVTFFHASSLENMDFPDAVAAAPPEMRAEVNLVERRLFDPDRQMAKRVQNVMEDIFSFWGPEVENLVDWVVKQDSLQGVGVLFALEAKLSELEESNQEYLSQTLSKAQIKLMARFDRFVDEQIRAIEDTKVKIKKRKGVITFIKVFPFFAAAVETMLPSPRANRFEVRHMVDEVYTRINKAMFESLKFIAKDSPNSLAGGSKGNGAIGAGGTVSTAAGIDAEDKEVLNYHILLIENMNHYVEEVEVRENGVLAEWKDRAFAEMDEHLALYLSAVLRRPLGKLLDFIESSDTLLQSLTDPRALANRPSHSKSAWKKLIVHYDAKEIRRGAETLKKRVEKHFSEGDDAVLARDLVTKVWKECDARYRIVRKRTEELSRDVYEGDVCDIEWRIDDVAAIFRK
ncbi:hypothetical protein MMC25_005846 [Agyrium rufum]|nr:hypothetical protein [Agyrium rufum]